MPYLSIKTNCDLDGVDTDAFLRQASEICAKALSKPDSSMMVSLDACERMLFAGESEPAAFVELRALGLPEFAPACLSAILCGLLSDKFGIKPDRVYINFFDIERTHWGWDSKTFG